MGRSALFALVLFATSAHADGQGFVLRGAGFSGTCGDGDVGVTEACDADGVDTSTCNGPAAGATHGCQATSCGDGYVNAAAGEECESGTCCNTGTCLFKSNGTSCRAAEDGCDPAETCTGSSTSCPADTDNCDDSCRTCTGSSCADKQVTLIPASTWSAGLNQACDDSLGTGVPSDGLLGKGADVAFSNTGNLSSATGTSYANVGLRNSLPNSGFAGVDLTCSGTCIPSTCDIKSVVVRLIALQEDPVANQFLVDQVCIGAQSGSGAMTDTVCNSTNATLVEDSESTFTWTLNNPSGIDYADFSSNGLAVGACLFGEGLDVHNGFVDYIEADVTYGVP